MAPTRWQLWPQSASGGWGRSWVFLHPKVGGDVGSRAGVANKRPARWALVLDQIAQQPPPCMPDRQQWLLYLSGVAVVAMADRIEAQRITRTGRVSPCQECSRGFKAEAEARGVCRPEWFKESA